MAFSGRAATAVRPVLAQQSGHQARYGRPGILRQMKPLRFWAARTEQLQLRRFGFVSSATSMPTAHLRASDPGGKDLSLRQKPARSTTEAARKSPPRPAAVRVARQVRSNSSLVTRPSASIRRPQARTSRPAVPANAPSSDHQGCNERCSFPAARPPLAHAPSARTTDARGIEHAVPRSHGRSVADFYNTRRPHQALGDRPPMAVWREGVIGALDETTVDMTLRLDNAGALPTCPQPPQQQQVCIA
jgi:hypothetical protein